MARFCTNCGAELRDNAVFCSACGTKLDITEKLDTPAANITTDQKSHDNVEQVSNIQPEAEGVSAWRGDENDGINSLRAKANANTNKPPKNPKKIIIICLCIAILAAGGVAAYLLLTKESGNNSSSSLQSVDSQPAVTSTVDSSTTDSKSPVNPFVDSQTDTSAADSQSDDSSQAPEQDPNKWMTKNLSEINTALESKEVALENSALKANKLVTNISSDYSKSMQYLSQQYDDTSKYVITENNSEQIYTKKKKEVNYAGINGNYAIAVKDKSTKNQISGIAFETRTATFEGALSFSFYETLTGDMQTVQEKFHDHIKGFVSDNIAEYLTYGKGNSIPEIDANQGEMKYTGLIKTQNINVQMERKIEKIDDTTYYISAMIRYTPNDDSSADYALDSASSVLYDNTTIKISDILPGVKTSDYKDSHNFMLTNVKNLILKDQKLIDTKLLDLTVQEKKADNQVKTSYAFQVASGFANSKYETTQRIAVDAYAVQDTKNKEYQDYEVTVKADLKTTDVTQAAANTAKIVRSIFPGVKNTDIVAKDIEKALNNQSSSKFRKEIVTTLFGEKVILEVNVDFMNNYIVSMHCLKSDIPVDDSSSQTDSKSDSKTDSGADSKTDSKSDSSKSDSKTDSKTDSKS